MSRRTMTAVLICVLSSTYVWPKTLPVPDDHPYEVKVDNDWFGVGFGKRGGRFQIGLKLGERLLDGILESKPQQTENGDFITSTIERFDLASMTDEHIKFSFRSRTKVYVPMWVPGCLNYDITKAAPEELELIQEIFKDNGLPSAKEFLEENPSAESISA